MKTIEIPRAKIYAANIRLYGEHGDTCVICGRRTNDKYFIHATTDWVAVNESDDSKVPNTQGSFAIGSDCAKLMPKDFVFINK